MRLLFMLCSLLLAVISAVAAEPSVLVNAKYLVDDNSIFHKSQVSQDTSLKWKDHADEVPISIGFNNNTAIWLKYQVHNGTSKTVSLVIDLQDPNLDTVEVFYEDSRKLMGDRVEGSWLPALVPYASVTLEGGTTATVLIRLKKVTAYLRVKPRVVESDLFFHTEAFHLVMSSFVIGVLILFFLFNFFLTVFSRRPVYAWYVFSVFLNLCYISSSTGVLKSVALPSFVHVGHIRIYSAFLDPMVFCGFLYHFVSPSTDSWLTKSMRLQGWLLFIVILASAVLYVPIMRFQWVQQFSSIGYFLIITLMLTTVLHVLSEVRYQRSRALFVLSTFVLFILAIIVLVLSEVQLISVEVPRDAFYIIVGYEVVLFGIAVARMYFKTFSENNLLLQELVKAKEENLNNLSRGEQNERKRLATLLHDHFGGRLVTLGVLAKRSKDAELETEIGLLSGELRNLSHRIMPASLEEGRLADAFRQHVEHLNQLHGEEKFKLHFYDFPEKIDAPWVYDLFLMCIELCTNSFKHSSANTTTFEYYRYPDHYLIHYSDDGVGFDSAQTRAGTGLTDIHARLTRYKGALVVDSGIGAGTEIFITIPIE